MKYLTQSQLVIIVLAYFITACTTAQISSAVKSATDILTEDKALTTNEVVAGLKEALVKGAESSTGLASQIDGYFKSQEIKIPFPPQIVKIETKLRQIGLNKLVDDFILSVNRAAEEAAKEAKPLFVTAITSMTIDDAWNILKGDNHAATSYLRGATSAQLEKKFEPIIERALATVNATKYYTEMTSQYNRLPFVTKVETDLTNYVNQRAMEGLFLLVAKEEEKIREDPLKRTTALLKKVFGYE